MSVLLQEMLVDGTPHAPFISTWRTAAAGETVTLPLSGGAGSGYGFVVDWGDGTVEAITSATDPKRIHTYAAAGDHQIKITGALVGWAFANAGDKLKIRSVDQWGTLRFSDSQSGHFQGCNNLTVPATDVPTLSASCVSMFENCKALSKSPMMPNWDTSKVKSMTGMFQYATNFNEDIGNWNVSSVTQMYSMFAYCTLFNQDISRWNTSKVLSLSNMFQGAAAFNQNIGSWITSSCVSMSSMFNNATSFDQDIGGWDISKVTSMATMFHSSPVFNQDISRWNTAKVTNVSQMFYNCQKFNQPIGTWNTSSVTNFSGMLQGTKVFNQDVGSWNTIAATNMRDMFGNAVAFNCGQPAGSTHTRMQRTASGGWRIGGITSIDLTAMFFGATSFAGDISAWCADVATTLPPNFSTNTHVNFAAAFNPTWGACPIPD